MEQTLFIDQYSLKVVISNYIGFLIMFPNSSVALHSVDIQQHSTIVGHWTEAHAQDYEGINCELE